MAAAGARDGGEAPGRAEAEGSPERDLAGALHEVSNALTVVLGWIEAARESVDGEPVARSLDVAIERARLAHGIVRRAIGAEVPGDEPRAAADVARDAVIGLEPEARRSGIELRIALDPELETVLLAAPPGVLQILTNLLLNAISVSSPGGAVTVDGRVEGARAVIGVSDTGPGVPLERRAGIFVDGISTRRGGAGIGLRHASAVARAGGGELSLRSARTGARFELAWPCHLAASADEPGSSPRKRSEMVGSRILLVEDDAAVVELLEVALGARGAEVVVVRRHRDLAAALALGPFHAALFDLSPIQDDVAGALCAVRDASPEARLLVISGSSIELPALPSHLNPGWVRKPFEVGEIVTALGMQAKR